MIFDLIIIGAGPAGLSAAVYATRKKLKVLVLADQAGGQIIEGPEINNYLGVPAISGIELVEKFKEHAKKLAVDIKEGIAVKNVMPADDSFEIKTSKEDFRAKALIIATGKQYRKLTIPGAKEFDGKGITYCATCDAPLFTNKKVAVIGAGDSGQDTAWQLTKYASQIFLLNKYPDLRGGDLNTQEKIKNEPKIEIFNSCDPLEIKGEKFVKSLVLKCNGSGQIKEIDVSGIFVEIGSVPVSEFLGETLKLNERREITIDARTNATSCPGIFAAGDVTDIPYKQIIIAAGEGAKAALSAYAYLKNK